MKKKIVPVGFFVLIVVLGALILFVTNKHSGTSAIPFVKVNDVIYVYDSTGYKVEELPETYSVIGEVIGNTASASKAQNGYASGLKVGEKIYQTSVKTDEVFVYTSLFPEMERIDMLSLLLNRMNSYLPPPLLKKMCCIQILFATPSKFQMVLSRHYLTSSRR